MEALRIKPRSFEQQFRLKEYFNFREGNVTVVDIIPEIMTDSVPVLIAPGWNENFDTYTKSLKFAFEHGRRVISFDYSRTGGKVPKESGYPAAELRKSLQILEVLKTKQLKEVDVIAHSEGAINVGIAADIKPEKFRNIVFDRPMGMVGPENRMALFARWFKMRRIEKKLRPQDTEDPVSAAQVSARFKKYFMENKWRGYDEVTSMTNFDLVPILFRLRENGINFEIIASDNDLMSPLKRQRSHAKFYGEEFPTHEVAGTHNMLSINPEMYTRLALGMLENLQLENVRHEFGRR